MNFLAVLFMTQLLYVVGVGEVQDPELCVGLAFSLQYMRLTVFCWMLLMSHHITFKNNANLLPHVDTSIKTSFWKFSLIGWCSPGILLCISIFLQSSEFDYTLILNVTDFKRTNCWFLSRKPFIYGYALPVIILLLMIIVSFIRTAIVIRQTTSLQVQNKNLLR
ncbi:conserved hypothetical protein [Pediculus humanus corporis]|uniref:G-protein coupled receptors family 2 profile 2 domain-containing protein n=1 Tax=Pediculus humanus subsp. corporis TaxID=121224 RepID=E0V9F3_PEDHC|nr:uncharacterized protein Phum_PHUM010590 [Pediculus humanus corporis]EEB10009.1 conserved hypothetical protein [Pediculus humanus corporis]